MSTTELRIGNLILDDLGRVSQVSCLTSQTIESIIDEDGRAWTTVFRPEPIAISDEWLIRFGFKNVRTESDINAHWEKQFGPFIIHFEIPDVFDQYGFNHCFLDSVGIDIDYVHQLQNLHFSLTGVELPKT